jgi:hypothetical protein
MTRKMENGPTPLLVDVMRLYQPALALSGNQTIDTGIGRSRQRFAMLSPAEQQGGTKGRLGWIRSSMRRRVARRRIDFET